MTAIQHPFEARGLGIAPFRFTGWYRSEYKAAPDAPSQPGTCCDYCGTGIKLVCRIVDSTGREFKVGSDCVAKVGADYDDTLSAAARKVKADIRHEAADARRKQEMEKTIARVASARAALEARPTLLTDQPHPNPYYASTGKTRRDYVLFLLQCGGGAGKNDACRAIERAVEAGQ